ncbi:MAG TPA: type II CAAX endopeptidase family protein [candidate division Zixibacteria bacterium]|nr:type II CAAX endopeptidase family protein [candidate division Zixibacteria bacterium]
MTENQPTYQAVESPSSPSPLIPWGWLRALLFIVVLVIVSLGIGAVTALFFDIWSAEDEIAAISSSAGILINAFQLAVLLGVTALMRRFVDRQSVLSLGFSLKSPYLKDLFAGLLWGFGMISAIFLILWSIGAIEVTEINFPLTSLLVMIPSLFFAAAQEEIIVRGYLLNNLMQSFNKYVALALTGLVFSLAHMFNPSFGAAALANIIMAGFVLGIYYIHRRNLWFPIGLHLAWNYFQGAIYGSPVSGLTTPGVMTLEFNPSYDSLTGGTFGFEAGWLTAILLVIVTVSLHFLYRPKPSRDIQSIPQSH